MNIFDKYLDERNNFDRMLYTRNYRSLVIYENEIYSSFGRSEKEIPYCFKKTNEKNFTINNEKRNKKKSEHSYKTSLINNKGYKEPMKCNSKIFHRTCSDFERKFLNALDKMCFLKKIRMNNDESYRKLKNKKYKLRLGLLLLVFLLVLMIPMLDLSFTYGGQKNGLLGTLGLLSVTVTRRINSLFLGGDITISGPIVTWFGLSQKNFVGIETAVSILFYCVPFFILAIILITAVVYYYKNSIKNQKIKFKETFYE
ncbi:Plasmodium exported protein, unknown function [Plasmodium malariae]|uniref:Uncharacterized protein n=1 Tax=Plasmodium malariae TaxID=5858 RepID=A0A1D3PA13_PLAMA|nr:Plasmodium exported protein, unknown function [Plasmodium malariae]SCN12029.1 Plasmodium exported protein, unknown function [Plasmodium malariae]